MDVLVEQHGGSWQRRSLIDDAKFDTLANAEIERQERTSQSDAEPHHNQTTNALSVNDEVFDKVTKPEVTVVQKKCSLVFGVRESGGLSRVFKHFENNRITLQHIETRKTKNDKNPALEFFVTLEGLHDDVITVVKSLKQCSATVDVSLVSESDASKKVPWIPIYISDLDRCQHLFNKFDPDIDQGHPGFSDSEYRNRRASIATIAFEHKFGDPIKRVEYSIDEIRTWATVFRNASKLYPTYACKEFLNVFRTLEKECGYSEHNIPQLEDVSNFLKRSTGFQLRPVAGLLTARDFLASMAFRVFQCTQYIRHGSNPEHTVEPDAVHELLGHVPMLADPSFAEFSQEIGLASLGASDADIEKFATLYWFTVEFGLCKQDGQIKAYGAGLLSAYGELLYAMSDKPEIKCFEPSITALQEYDDQDYQTTYFVAESFEDMKQKVRQYARLMDRPFDVRYNPFTQSVQILNNKEVIEQISRSVKGEINCLQNALGRIENITVT